MYRAIEDQLKYRKLNVKSFQELRRIAGQHIRSNAESYAPFLGLEPEGEALNDYCNKVESDVLAEWGGELEIRAISESLAIPIHVYSADSPVLVMEGSGDTSVPPLTLSFHRHLLVLGEHYNSRVSI